MARGTPDWYRGFEIFGGGVRLFVRPSYGAGQRSVYSGTPDWRVLTELILVEGQGIIYGGWLEVKNTQSSKYDSVKISVDGTLLFQTEWQYLYKASLDGRADVPYYLTVYDEVVFYYSLCFKRGITFDESYKVEYYRESLSITTLNCRLMYALAP